MADSGLSGLGASIRRAVDSETFDLAGKNASTIESAIRDAFAQPFPLAETIRLTFVTGAGKLARQKYDDGAAKAITSALRDFGYQEDQSGGAGTFKLQHDTGKNLKTVVVHPNVTGSGGSPGNGGNKAGAMGSMSLDQQKAINSLIPDGTPEHKIAYASTNVFQRMIASMCPSWSQKKGCVAKIDDIMAMLRQLDEKLLTGTPLDDAEQALYDSVSMTSLDEKQTHVRDLIFDQVDQGEITADERKLLLAQVQEKLTALTKDLAEAEAQGKPTKRIETLKSAIEKGKMRLEKINKITPKPLAKLKNDAQIIKLRTEMIPLTEIETSTKGQLRSIKDTQAIARKEEIEQEIEALENASRGWFETDEEFAARVEASRAAWKPPSKKKKTPSGAGSGSAFSAKSSWATTTSSASRARKPASSSKPTGPTAKSNKPKGGGVFAAMMMDSDSD